MPETALGQCTFMEGDSSPLMATGTVYHTVRGVPNILYWQLVSGVPPRSAEP